jgi:FAD/FMN-containing dehydrogenase
VYENSIDSYFSVLEQELTPYCFMSSNGCECQFAVRCGGHTPWAGAANIDGGITIDLSGMKSVTYSAATNTTAVEPGATWHDVYLAAHAEGHMVAGGRSSTVGVGGLVLGGGNSFYAARMGLVCDNVHQFEPDNDPQERHPCTLQSQQALQYRHPESQGPGEWLL